MNVSLTSLFPGLQVLRESYQGQRPAHVARRSERDFVHWISPIFVARLTSSCRAGFTGAFVDRLVETKGVCWISRFPPNASWYLWTARLHWYWRGQETRWVTLSCLENDVSLTRMVYLSPPRNRAGPKQSGTVLKLAKTTKSPRGRTFTEVSLLLYWCLE